MKHTLHILTLILTVFALQTGCSTSDIKPGQLEGIYEGTFILLNASKGTRQTAAVELSLTTSDFTCSGNPNQMPAGGLGSYSVKGNTIKFEDNSIYRPGFDHHLVLSGAYEFTFEGAQLVLWKEALGNQYRYELNKR